MNQFRRVILLLLSIALFQACSEKKDWDLVWSEEFEYSGEPNPEYWDYEIGFIRNQELQYYTNHFHNQFIFLF